MMKILHVITSLHTGGAEKLMVDLLPRMNAMDDAEVELCVFDGERTPFYEQLQAKGVRIHALTRSAYSLMNVVKLIPLMRKYDVIHTHNTSCQFAVALLSYISKARLATTEHNTTNRRRDNKLWYWLDRWMYSRYDRVICISDKAKANLQEYLKCLDDGKVCTIYNGIDLSCYSSSYVRKNEFDKKIITMVAAFRKQKDQKTLIRAMELLPDNYILQLVGDGELVDDVKAWVNTLSYSNRIVFLGMRSDVPKILSASDVVVLSSHYEGLSLSSIEGLACGRPFVASDVDGLHEIVDGYGVLFEHENHVMLANEIKRLCKDGEYSDAVVRKCQERAKQYDIENMKREYCAIYM